MKKSLLLMFMLINSSIFGQEVAILHDENQEDYRKIQTHFTPLAKKGLAELPFSLSFFSPTGTENGEAHYTLAFKITLGTIPQTLPKGSKLYIKLDDDSIVELESINEIEIINNESEYIAGLLSTYYYIYPIYYILPEQLEQLMTHNVVKLRRQVTWGNGYYDIPDEKFFKDKHLCFTENLIRMKNAIDRRLEKAEKQDDLLKDF